MEVLVGAVTPLALDAAHAGRARGLATFAHELFVFGDQFDAADVDSALANAAAVANARCSEVAQNGRLAHYATRFSVQVHPKVAIYLEALSKEFGASLGTLSSVMLNRAVYRMHPTIVQPLQTNRFPPVLIEKARRLCMTSAGALDFRQFIVIARDYVYLSFVQTLFVVVTLPRRGLLPNV